MSLHTYIERHYQACNQRLSSGAAFILFYLLFFPRLYSPSVCSMPVWILKMSDLFSPLCFIILVLFFLLAFLLSCYFISFFPSGFQPSQVLGKETQRDHCGISGWRSFWWRCVGQRSLLRACLVCVYVCVYGYLFSAYRRVGELLREGKRSEIPPRYD